MITDPSVAKMNDTQWLFEYQGLLKREERESQRAVLFAKEAKHTIAHLLGVDLVYRAGIPREEQPIVPLSLLCGRPEVLKQVLEEAQVEMGVAQSLEDEEYERWSAMMAGEDMVPYDEPGPGTSKPDDGGVWSADGGPGEPAESDGSED